MTYLEIINAFWKWTSSNEISHAEVDLYFSILNVANTTNWKTRLSIPNSTFGRFEKNTLIRTRQNLITKGLIQYQKGRKGQAGIYIINEIGFNNDTNNDTDNDTNMQPKTIPKQRTYIDKDQTKTRQRDNNPFIPFEGKLLESVNTWLAYKAERGQKYKPTGLKTLFKKIQDGVDEYGETAVIRGIDNSIANNWQGLFFGQKQTAVKSDNPFLDMLKNENSEDEGGIF